MMTIVMTHPKVIGNIVVKEHRNNYVARTQSGQKLVEGLTFAQSEAQLLDEVYYHISHYLS